MIIDVIGWISTILIVVGYFLNSKQMLKQAILVWIIGDIGWITYDIFIDNWSHLVLSFVIISLNLYGIFNLWKKRNLK